MTGYEAGWEDGRVLGAPKSKDPDYQRGYWAGVDEAMATEKTEAQRDE